MLFLMKHFVCLFLWVSTALFGKQTVCLNMIVKDEAHVIERCLDSAKPLIDYWVIVDTGSTDGTQQIIRDYLKDIPGKLYERPWVDFGHNRNEALSFAKGRADYILFLDADDWYQYDDDFTLPNLDKDAYLIWLGHENLSYQRPLLVRDALPWKWVGVLHEFITADCQYSQETLEGVFCINGGDGASWSDPEKYKKHAQIFEDALKKEPGNTRYMLYLGQSYNAAGEPEKALKAYEKRIEMGGHDGEVFMALYQRALLIGKKEGPGQTAINALMRAHNHSPRRPEPIYYLAKTYNILKEYGRAYHLLKEFQKTPWEKDPMINLDWIVNWGIPFELSMSAYYVGEDEESLAICDQLLEMENVPEIYREQVVENRRWPEQRLKQKR